LSEAARARGRSWTYQLWLVTAVLVVVGFVFFHMEIIADGFWYLAAGRHLLQTGDLYASDPFSYTAVRQPWIIHYVAVVFLFAELERLFGLFSIIVVSALVQAVAYLIVWLAHARRGLAHFVTFLWTLLSIQLASPNISARGAAFGDVCFACLMLLIWRLKEGRRVHWAAPIALGAAWANVHSSFPLLVLTPLFVALSLRVLEPPDDRPPLAPFVRFAVLSMVGGGITPYSWLLPYDGILEVGRADTWNIDLFRSPPMHQPIWIAAIGLILVLFWVRGRFGPKRHARTEVALLLCYLLASLLWLRIASQLMLAAAVIIAQTVNELANVRPAPRRFSGLLAVAASIQLCVFAWLAHAPKDPFLHGPFAAAAFIEAQHLPEHVWARYDWGSYLLYAWKGQRKVFIDGRSYLYFNGVFEDDLAIQSAARQTGELLSAYGINTLLCPRGSNLHRAAANSELWVQRYADERAVVFVRR
jgi:hypothetical protein